MLRSNTDSTATLSLGGFTAVTCSEAVSKKVDLIFVR